MGVLDLRIFQPEEEYFYENIYKTQKSLLSPRIICQLFYSSFFKIGNNVVVKSARVKSSNLDWDIGSNLVPALTFGTFVGSLYLSI